MDLYSSFVINYVHLITIKHLYSQCDFYILNRPDIVTPPPTIIYYSETIKKNIFVPSF